MIDNNLKKELNPKELLIALSIILGFIAITYFFNSYNQDPIKDITYNDFLNYLNNGKVKEILENAPYIIATIKENGYLKKIKFPMITNRLGDDISLMSKISEAGISVNVKPQVQTKTSPIIYLLLGISPVILLIAFSFYFASKATKNQGNLMNISEDYYGSSLVVNATKVTFEDVAGAEEAKEELKEVVDFLKNPNKFLKLGAKIPKGVLLLGRPGTGKTLLAKAIAGEANVAFINKAGSEFLELFAGAGALKVRQLFKKARRNAPCIIFIDEIDAVAGKRGRINSHEEREQTLNQLLVEMDGFDSSEGVIVIAATNRPEILDEAILRPGRFDRQITINIPSITEREAILKVHAKNKPLDPTVNLKDIAKKTPGFVGADLQNILNEGAILAARRERSVITQKDLEDAIERVLTGPERKTHLLSDKEKRIVAYHEAGHALVSYLIPNADPVHKISIIPRGYGALGYTLQLPNEDKYLTTKQEYLDRIKILLGGRIAEEIIFREMTSGAADDIKKATAIAKAMVIKLGMSNKVGLRNLDFENEYSDLNKYSNETTKNVDEEIENIIDGCYKEARTLLENNLDKLEILAKELLTKEVLVAEDLPKILGNKE